MSAFTCPICRAHCPTLADVLSCHPRQTRALTGRAHSSHDVIAVLSGEQLAGQRRPVRAAVADQQDESEAA
ncbi:MAG: hypothetical protein KBF28_11135 [Gemmatimonadales bacterium]|nr:hypothetical protein [Gemmatimonadales bacterium]